MNFFTGCDKFANSSTFSQHKYSAIITSHLWIFISYLQKCHPVTNPTFVAHSSCCGSFSPSTRCKSSRIVVLACWKHTTNTNNSLYDIRMCSAFVVLVLSKGDKCYKGGEAHCPPCLIVSMSDFTFWTRNTF